MLVWGQKKEINQIKRPNNYTKMIKQRPTGWKALFSRIKIITSIVLCNLMLLFVFACQQHKPECVNDQPLKLSLSQLSKLEFEVEFKNISQTPCYFALPLQYPSYSALSFVVTDSGGGEFVFIYKGLTDAKPSHRNLFPQAILHPGDTFKMKVNLNRTHWQWPDLISLDKTVQLKACYNYPKPIAPNLNNIWYGSISSNFINWKLPDNERRCQLFNIFMTELPE